MIAYISVYTHYICTPLPPARERYNGTRTPAQLTQRAAQSRRCQMVHGGPRRSPEVPKGVVSR
eukprot:4710783-Pyramimonas_sp.AAC.1